MSYDTNDAPAVHDCAALEEELARLRADAEEAALATRREFAAAWNKATRQKIGALDFTPERLLAELKSRWFERRSLADGTAPAEGQRVVIVREVAERWGLAHAHDDLVHEITSLLSGDTHLVECGPQQIGMGMLRRAPPGADVTCKSCRGWSAYLKRLRIDNEVFRERQVHDRLMEIESGKVAVEAQRQLARERQRCAELVERPSLECAPEGQGDGGFGRMLAEAILALPPFDEEAAPRSPFVDPPEEQSAPSGAAPGKDGSNP